MNVLVRVREPTPKQERYFGENAWRPFAYFQNISSEEELIGKLKRVLNGEKVKGVIIYAHDIQEGEFQYAVVTSNGFGNWVNLGAL